MSSASRSAPRTAVYLQDACYQHRFIRSKDLSNIVERPERLRAVKVGISAAIARLETRVSASSALPGPSVSDKDDATPDVKHDPASEGTSEERASSNNDADDLAVALQRLEIASNSSSAINAVNIVRSTASVDLLKDPAVKFIHGDINKDVYLENLASWAKDSEAKVLKGESDIPVGLSQGDLYLCPGSLPAIQGALGTVCEAVDDIIRSTSSPNTQADLSSNSTDSQASTSSSSSSCTRAFVAIRPPGHHCGEDTPSGFCFVNNVAVAAAHAHLKYGIQKVVIFDIDLHHGNGTQAIAWQINEEAYRLILEEQYSEQPDPPKPGLQVYYGSVHDIFSYPCEDGNAAIVQAASVSIHGAHGQYIENVHLGTYENEDEFWDKLYHGPYSRLLNKAQEFIGDTPAKDVLVFVSCGFDACEHEYSSMSRHGRRVPVSFYYQFAKDAAAFADKFADGRLISVLEGGYSDRALTSGAMAHLVGLADGPGEVEVDRSWWDVDNLVKLEQATKKRRGGKISLPAPGSTPEWLERTISIFSSIETVIPAQSRVALITPSRMTLRERRAPSPALTSTPVSAPPRRGGPKPKPVDKESGINGKTGPDVDAKSISTGGGASVGASGNAPPGDSNVNGGDRDDDAAARTSEVDSSAVAEGSVSTARKLPRVILRVRDPNEKGA